MNILFVILLYWLWNEHQLSTGSSYEEFSDSSTDADWMDNAGDWLDTLG